MSKIELNDLLAGSNLQKINDNFDKIQDALDNKVLYRNNPDGTPNEMHNALDMNSNRIINLPEPIDENEAARLKDVIFAATGSPIASITRFTPTDDLESTNVQAAIQEVNDKLYVSPFQQIPPYPQSFKDQATRILAGNGRALGTSIGSPGSYVTGTNPGHVDQMWSNASLPVAGTNWFAHKAIQTTMGPASQVMAAGLFSEMATYHPGVGEAVGIVGMSRALADRIEGSQQFDCWGAWLIGTNNGWLANVSGVEVNATNQNSNFLDVVDPTILYPAHFAVGVQVFNDWSIFHNTRGLNITGSNPFPGDPNNRCGWDIGANIVDYVNTGIFLDTLVAWRDPDTKTIPANPVGITFGHHTPRKLAFNAAAGDTRWQLNMEATYLVWRANVSNWYMSMNDADKSVHFVNDLFKMDTNGRLNVGTATNLGNTGSAGAGLSIVGSTLPFVMGKTTAGNTAPGAGTGVIRFEAGTTAGTMKIAAYAGTSNVGVVLADNIGAGF